MEKRKKGLGVGSTLLLLLSGFIALAICLAALLRGKNIAVLNSKGLIASEQRELIVISILVVLAVAIPTLVILYFVAWRYRESNSHATYHPSAKQSKLFEFSIWAIPSLFMLILAFVLVPATHKLEPKKAIASDAKPLTIQVVAMQWKWVFIYPEEQIATVNFVQIPEDRPVTFILSADEAPMSSFWIPNLGGQIYAMTGHVNRLNLLASEPGDFPGKNVEINGAGYAYMDFITRVSSESDFTSWVATAQQSPKKLDKNAYQKLLRPTEDNQMELYSSVENDLFASAVMKYAGSHGEHSKASNETQKTQNTKHEGAH